MAKIEFLGPINKRPLEIEASSLEDIKEILNKDKELKDWLEICSIAVNDALVSSLDTPIKKNDTISLLPPVCGG